MTRRKPDPPSTFDEWRTAIRYRLIDEVGISAAMADQWVRVWEMEAASRDVDRDSPHYWSKGFDWILKQLAKR